LPRKSEPSGTPPDLAPERAYAALSGQLAALQNLRGRDYREAKANEDEWKHFTEKLTIRAFGSDSVNVRNFYHARSAGEHYIVSSGVVPHQGYQHNFLARIQAYEAFLNSCLSELQLDLPKAVKGVYEPGQEYEFYSDVKGILGLARKEVFVIDPHISPEMFDVYAGAIPRTVSLRLLSANVPAPVLAIAHKYASGGNLQLRNSTLIHDRVIFADDRVWVCGQSLKDAAKKKPTYIIEHDEPLMRATYENIWSQSTTVI
jgi:hypothetical protein